MAPPVASNTEPTTLARRAAEQIAEQTGVPRHRVALVLGSGWQEAAAELGEPTASVAMTDLAGFAPPTALGHRGIVQSVRVGQTPVMTLLGRRHLYEGCGPEQVVHPVLTAIAAGAEVVVLTNAAGGTRPEYAPGQAVLISDHLNLTGATPLSGARFIDMVDTWDAGLRAVARQVDSSLAEGVYAGLLGPQYETPAEVRMLTRLGADLIGMSTVLEAIAARAAGARLLGISLVTNLAAGITGEPLDHNEVLAEGQAAARRLGRVLRGVMARL